MMSEGRSRSPAIARSGTDGSEGASSAAIKIGSAHCLHFRRIRSMNFFTRHRGLVLAARV